MGCALVVRLLGPGAGLGKEVFFKLIKNIPIKLNQSTCYLLSLSKPKTMLSSVMVVGKMCPVVDIQMNLFVSKLIHKAIVKAMILTLR